MSWTFRVSLKNVCLTALGDDEVVSSDGAFDKATADDTQTCTAFWHRFVDASMFDLSPCGRHCEEWEPLLCFYFDGVEKRIPLHLVRATPSGSNDSPPLVSSVPRDGSDKVATGGTALMVVPKKDTVFSYTITAQSAADLASSLAQRSAVLHLLLRRSRQHQCKDGEPPPAPRSSTAPRTQSREGSVAVDDTPAVCGKGDSGSHEVLVLASATASLLDLAVAENENFFFGVYRAGAERGDDSAAAPAEWRGAKRDASPQGRVSLSLNMAEEREVRMQLQLLCVRGLQVRPSQYWVRYGWQHNPMLALGTRERRLQASRSHQSSPSRSSPRPNYGNAQANSGRAADGPTGDEGCVTFTQDQLPPLNLTCSRAALERQQMYVAVLTEPPLNETSEGVEDQQTLKSGKLVTTATGELSLGHFLVAAHHHDEISAPFTIPCTVRCAEVSSAMAPPTLWVAEGMLVLKEIPCVRFELEHLAPSLRQRSDSTRDPGGGERRQPPLAGSYMETDSLFSFAQDIDMTPMQSLRIYEGLSAITYLDRSTPLTDSPSLLLSSISPAPSFFSRVDGGKLLSTQTLASPPDSPPPVATAGEASHGRPALRRAGVDDGGKEGEGASPESVEEQGGCRTSQLQAVPLMLTLEEAPGEEQPQPRGPRQTPQRTFALSGPPCTAGAASMSTIMCGESANEPGTLKDILDTPSAAAALLLNPEMSRMLSLSADPSRRVDASVLSSTTARVTNPVAPTEAGHAEKSKWPSTVSNAAMADGALVSSPTPPSHRGSGGASFLHRLRAAREPRDRCTHAILPSVHTMPPADALDTNPTCSADSLSPSGCRSRRIEEYGETCHFSSTSHDTCKTSRVELSGPLPTSSPTLPRPQGATEHVPSIATGNTTPRETAVQGTSRDSAPHPPFSPFERVRVSVSQPLPLVLRDEPPHVSELILSINEGGAVERSSRQSKSLVPGPPPRSSKSNESSEVHRVGGASGLWKAIPADQSAPEASGVERALSFLSATSDITAPVTKTTSQSNPGVQICVGKVPTAPEMKSIPAANASVSAAPAASLYYPTTPPKLSRVVPSPLPSPKPLREVHTPPPLPSPLGPCEGSGPPRQTLTWVTSQYRALLRVYEEKLARMHNAEGRARGAVSVDSLGREGSSFFEGPNTSVTAGRAGGGSAATEWMASGIREADEKWKAVEALQARRSTLRQRLSDYREAQRSKVAQLRCRDAELTAAEEDLRDILSQLLLDQMNLSELPPSPLQRAVGQQTLFSPLHDAARSTVLSVQQPDMDARGLRHSDPALLRSSVPTATTGEISTLRPGPTPKAEEDIILPQHLPIPVSPSSRDIPSGAPPLAFISKLKIRRFFDIPASRASTHGGESDRPAAPALSVSGHFRPGPAASLRRDDLDPEQRGSGPCPMTTTHSSWAQARLTNGTATPLSFNQGTPRHVGGTSSRVHAGEAATPSGVPTAYRRSLYARHLALETSLSPSPSLKSKERLSQELVSSSLPTRSPASPPKASKREKLSTLSCIEREALHNGVDRGDRALVTHLLRTKPHLFFSDPNLLHIACGATRPDVSIVETVLKLRPELAQGVDAITGNTALHVACAAPYPDAEIVKRLILSGIPIAAHNKEGFTAFHLALLNAGDAPAHRVKDTLLTAAGGSGSSSSNSSVNERTADGRTPLHLVCTSDEQLELVRYLAHRGADLWSRACCAGSGGCHEQEDITPSQLSRLHDADAVTLYLQNAALERTHSHARWVRF